MRFRLERGRHYALELISPEFGEQVRHCSPFKVYELIPNGDGNRRFQLSFYHAAYPLGARDKLYCVQVIDRTQDYLLGRLLGTERLGLFMHLSNAWLHKNFDDRAVAEFLEENKLTQEFS